MLIKKFYASTTVIIEYISTILRIPSVELKAWATGKGVDIPVA